MWTQYPALKVGDKITLPVPVYRKWWQLWRPRVIGHQDKMFVVCNETKSEFGDGGVTAPAVSALRGVGVQRVLQPGRDFDTARRHSHSGEPPERITPVCRTGSSGTVQSPLAVGKR